MNRDRHRDGTHSQQSAADRGRRAEGTTMSIDTDLSAESAQPLALPKLANNVSFRDQAYAALKQAIMDADIYGSADEIRLDERQLSEALGVSRTPIREAMTLLEQEGFVAHGAAARHLHRAQDQARDHRDDRDVGGAREHGGAARHAERVRRGHRGAAPHVRRRSRARSRREHIDEYSDANIAFHQAIIRLSGSHLMGKTIENLFIHVRAIRA